MIKLGLIFLIALAFVPPICGQKIEWKVFTSAENGFSVAFPGKPNVFSQDARPVLGKEYKYGLEVAGQAFMVMVNVTNFSLSLSESELGKLYDRGRDGGLTRLKDSKLIDERDITINGHFGRECMISDGELMVITRFFFYKGRLFQIATGMQVSQADNLEIKQRSTKFFESFALI